MTERSTSDGSPDGWVVTIEGNPGEVVQLQHFKRYQGERFSPEGPHWVGVLQSGFKQDGIDLTGYFYKRDKRRGQEKIAKPHLLALTQSSPWERTFNLLEPVSLFFEVKDAGTYRIEGKGAEGEYRFEPVDKGPRSKYQAPDFKPVNSDWELNPGHYELTFRPRAKGKGVITLQIRNKNIPFSRWYTDGIASSPADRPEIQERQTWIQYPLFNFQRNLNYRFEFNHRPGVHTGLVVRKTSDRPDIQPPGLPETGRALDIARHIACRWND